MTYYPPGRLQEPVVLTVSNQHGEAYDISIQHSLESELHKSISISARPVVLRRLEEKSLHHSIPELSFS